MLGNGPLSPDGLRAIYSLVVQVVVAIIEWLLRRSDREQE